jgi:ATP-dependent Lhr-like helicase
MSLTFLKEKIHPGLQKCVIKNGWKGYSDIQISAFENIYNGDDCVVEAPTSGGKTEAVFFPTLSKAATENLPGVRILYLAPLKALLNNVEIRAKEYAEACGMHSFKWHGDVSQSKKVNEFINPSQLLLTTPESLEAILLRKPNWEDFFKNLQSIIIDETHNFASGDRGIHLLSLLERLEFPLEITPQRIAVTATIGNPNEMLKWLAGKKRKIGKRIHAISKREKEKDYKVYYFNEEDEKYRSGEKLYYCLYKTLPLKKTLIFIKSRKQTEDLAAKINEINSFLKTKNPIKIRTHHSSVSKFYREQAEFLIKVKNDSGLQVIINTSTLELGIDIGELDQVIQMSELTHPSSFLQRVGRTGRRGNKPQVFKGYCSEKEELLLLCSVVNLGLIDLSEKIYFPKKAFHILAHQIICLSLQMSGINPELAWNILSNSYSFSNITKNEFDELIANMVELNFLRAVDSSLIIGEQGEKSFLGLNWKRLFAVFDNSPLYDVVDGKTNIGTLDSGFVEGRPIPFIFVLGGIEWITKQIKYESRQVLVQKTKKGKGPSWFSLSGSDIPFETAQEAGKILFENKKYSYLDEKGIEEIDALRDKHNQLNWTNEKWIIDNEVPGECVIWTFGGTKINMTLASIIELFMNGKISTDYKFVQIKREDNIDTLLKDVIKLLNYVAKLSKENVKKLEVDLSKELRNTQFSKFSMCLSEELNKKTLADKLFDVQGLVNILKVLELIFTPPHSQTPFGNA